MLKIIPFEVNSEGILHSDCSIRVTGYSISIFESKRQEANFYLQNNFIFRISFLETQ